MFGSQIGGPYTISGDEQVTYAPEGPLGRPLGVPLAKESIDVDAIYRIAISLHNEGCCTSSYSTVLGQHTYPNTATQGGITWPICVRVISNHCHTGWYNGNSNQANEGYGPTNCSASMTWSGLALSGRSPNMLSVVDCEEPRVHPACSRCHMLAWSRRNQGPVRACARVWRRERAGVCQKGWPRGGMALVCLVQWRAHHRCRRIPCWCVD